MIDDAVVFHNLSAVHRQPLFESAWPVHAVADYEYDIFSSYSRRLYYFQERKEDAVFSLVGNGPGNIGHGNTNRCFVNMLAFRADDFGNGGRARRIVQGPCYLLFRMRKGGHFFHIQCGALRGNRYFQKFLSELNRNFPPVFSVGIGNNRSNIVFHHNPL